MTYEESMLRNDKIVMESLRAMAANQPVIDRPHYVDIALEAISNNATNARMIGNLYKEIMKASDIDFGKIPDSKGDLTKYKYYSQMEKTMEILNDLAKTGGVSNGPVINTMNNFHNILLDAREDFVFGYKFNIDMLKYIYQLNVLTLYEVINSVITEISMSLKDGAKVQTKMKPVEYKSNAYVDVANKFILSYNNGQWRDMMTSFRKNSSNFLGSTTIATVAGVLVGTTFGKVAMSSIAVLLGSRIAIYLFYSAKTKISQYAKIQAELIKASMEAEKEAALRNGNPAPDPNTKLMKMQDFLEGTSDFLEGTRKRKEKAAKKAIANSDTSMYSKSSMQDANADSSISFNDFELV